MKQSNYYAVIPANVRYDKNLTANAKLLYGEISALAQKNGVCFATNEYFSKLYNLSERAISRLICSLKDKNYIKVEIDNSESNKKHRQICLGGIDKNDNNTLDKNVQYNNTSSINNTSITKIPIVPLTNYENCRGMTNSKDACSKRARLKVGDLCLCGQHARMYLTQIGRTDLIVHTENFNKSLFDKFWNAYPKKKSKGVVEKWFTKNKPSEELVNEMIDKINLLKTTEQWKKNNGQYIPYPSTWLNAKGWEDEISSDGLIETEEEEIARLKAEIERRKANGDW